MDPHYFLLLGEQAGQNDPTEKACRECEGPLQGYLDAMVTDAEGTGYICKECEKA